jgi:hypothetical protein
MRFIFMKLKTGSVFCIILALSLTCTCRKGLSETWVGDKYPEAEQYNEAARFLAGMAVPAGSRLNAFTGTSSYRNYSKFIDSSWARYRKQKIREIEQWRKSNLKHVRTKSLFYPFSGPDLLNVLAFFPDSREITMIGLESPGIIPDSQNLQEWQVRKGLPQMQRALRTLLSLNLFRTREMQVDVRKDTICGITGIMMFFLARYEYEILDIREIGVLEDGTLEDLLEKRVKSRVRGVEVSFRKGRGAPVRKVRYFSFNIVDASLVRGRGFISFLSRKEEFTTFLKSASYLLSFPNFSTIRSYILSRSRHVVQGDSGIPLRFFNRKKWDLSFYGRYRVIHMFADRFQPDLARCFQEQSRGQLPFSFDYGFVPEKSNLMVANRINDLK